MKSQVWHIPVIPVVANRDKMSPEAHFPSSPTNLWAPYSLSQSYKTKQKKPRCLAIEQIHGLSGAHMQKRRKRWKTFFQTLTSSTCTRIGDYIHIYTPHAHVKNKCLKIFAFHKNPIILFLPTFFLWITCFIVYGTIESVVFNLWLVTPLGLNYPFCVVA